MAVQVLPAVQHEHFCLPRPTATEPRVETYVHYTEDASGRSAPTHNVTRCQECGATRYDRTEK